MILRPQDDQLSPVLPDRQMDFILDDGMGLGRVHSDDQDTVGFSDLTDRIGRGGNPQGLGQSLCERPVRTALVVDLIRSQGFLKSFWKRKYSSLVSRLEAMAAMASGPCCLLISSSSWATNRRASPRRPLLRRR